ncbi:hypothetical protein GW17_00005084 [Ensete ventricosum]|nr:hypothetical protein GW17_00005084 [Ensete ventricosum]
MVASDNTSLRRTWRGLGSNHREERGNRRASEPSVRMVLNNFFRGREALYLLQIDATKLGEELIYEAAEDTYFPHFYGPDRSYRPLSLDVVSKVEKLELKNAEFTCSLLDQA